VRDAITKLPGSLKRTSDSIRFLKSQRLKVTMSNASGENARVGQRAGRSQYAGPYSEEKVILRAFRFGLREALSPFPSRSRKNSGYFRDLLSLHIRAHNRRILAHLMVGGAPVAPAKSRSTMGTASVPSDSPRRMTRMRVEVRLRLATLAPAPLFAEETHTLVVNPQGCGVKLSRALTPGTRVLLDGLPGGLQATARVANCLPLGTDGRNFLLGLALDNPGNVWGIAKPPADWNDDEPLAAPVEDDVKKKNWPYSLFSAKGEAHPGRR
jgi:hypothetical protein